MSPNVFIMSAAELTFDGGRVLTVPIREGASMFVPCYFGDPTPPPGSCPGYRILMVIDGRMYRDICSVTYVDPDGRRLDAK